MIRGSLGVAPLHKREFIRNCGFRGVHLDGAFRMGCTSRGAAGLFPAKDCTGRISLVADLGRPRVIGVLGCAPGPRLAEGWRARIREDVESLNRRVPISATERKPGAMRRSSHGGQTRSAPIYSDYGGPLMKPSGVARLSTLAR